MTDNTWNQHLPSLSFIINLCEQAVAARHKQSMCYVCCVRVSNGAYLELEIKTMGRFSRAVFVLVYLSFLNTLWLLGPKYTKLLQVLNLDQSGGSVQPLFQIPQNGTFKFPVQNMYTDRNPLLYPSLILFYCPPQPLLLRVGSESAD